MQAKLTFVVLVAAMKHAACSKSNNAPSNPAPVANFTYTGAGFAPATVSFTNTSSNATSYLWDFGDNSTSTQANPTHTYTQGGDYPVKLTATGSRGSNSATKTINISTPISVRITGLKITAMPFLNPGCNCGWYAHLQGPDVYFQISSNSSNLMFRGDAFEDVTQAMLPLSWPFPPNYAYKIVDFAAIYKISVYDKDTNDSPPDSDDYIGDYSFSVSS